MNYLKKFEDDARDLAFKIYGYDWAYKKCDITCAVTYPVYMELLKQSLSTIMPINKDNPHSLEIKAFQIMALTVHIVKYADPDEIGYIKHWTRGRPHVKQEHWGIEVDVFGQLVKPKSQAKVIDMFPGGEPGYRA